MGETRKMNIERDSQCVGFSIGSGPQGGVFVSSVQEDSLAMEAGLVIGDQLLEVIYRKELTKNCIFIDIILLPILPCNNC